MVLNTGIKYKGSLTLTKTERVFANNNTIAKKLAGAGFKDVSVTSFGLLVMTVGVWNGPDNSELEKLVTGNGAEILKRAKIERV